MNIFNRKYRYFRSKVNDVTASIWDLEFKIAKSRQVREGVRQDRDRALEAVNQITLRIEGTKDKDAVKKLEEEKAKFEDNAKRYEAQMRMIDEQVNGVPAEGENPGQQGLLETLASLTELRSMYRDYAKTV